MPRRDAERQKAQRISGEIPDFDQAKPVARPGTVGCQPGPQECGCLENILPGIRDRSGRRPLGRELIGMAVNPDIIVWNHKRLPLQDTRRREHCIHNQHNRLFNIHLIYAVLSGFT